MNQAICEVCECFIPQCMRHVLHFGCLVSRLCLTSYVYMCLQVSTHIPGIELLTLHVHTPGLNRMHILQEPLCCIHLCMSPREDYCLHMCMQTSLSDMNNGPPIQDYASQVLFEPVNLYIYMYTRCSGHILACRCVYASIFHLAVHASSAPMMSTTTSRPS